MNIARIGSFRLDALIAVSCALILAGCTSGEEATEVAFEPFTIAAQGGTNPTVAMAHDGRGYVAWVGLDGDEYNVYLSTGDSGSNTFTAPVRVNDIPGDAAPHAQAPAQVAIGPQGNIYVLWQNNTAVEGREYPASDLRLAVSEDGGATFQPAITVNDDAGGPPSSHTFHDITVADDGSVVVSWIDSRVRDQLEAASGHAHAMGSMSMGSAESTVGESTGSMGSMGSMGEGSDGIPGPEIRVARSSDGGKTFAERTIIDSNACPCCRTSTAVGPDGSVYVAWRKVYDGNIRDIVVARAAPGGLEFGEPVRVHEDGWVFNGCPHAGPALEIGADGRLNVAWYTGADPQGLRYAESDDGGTTFSEPVPVLVADWVPPSKAVLAATGSDVWVGWEDQTAEPANVKLASLSSDGNLQPMAGSLEGSEPAMDSNGGATLVAWLDGESVRATWLNGRE